ncbi:hypothetical protein AJ88_01700 [Mesorhizobium amorphae CCBAU 01583]|nr:hypothetical protein AJ88_01700 [Mesorhizobium amorphae CCBAU 01583]
MYTCCRLNFKLIFDLAAQSANVKNWRDYDLQHGHPRCLLLGGDKICLYGRHAAQSCRSSARETERVRVKRRPIAGGRSMLMVGPPGSGKSMLAQRLPSILPPLAPKELLEVSMIASVAGELGEGKLTDRRPFRAPHIQPRWRRWWAAA